MAATLHSGEQSVSSQLHTSQQHLGSLKLVMIGLSPQYTKHIRPFPQEPVVGFARLLFGETLEG